MKERKKRYIPCKIRNNPRGKQTNILSSFLTMIHKLKAGMYYSPLRLYIARPTKDVAGEVEVPVKSLARVERVVEIDCRDKALK